MDVDAAIAMYGVEALSERDGESSFAGTGPEPSRSESAPDPKPEPRIRDPEVFKRFHEGDPDCVSCGGSRVQAHHILSRAQNGDDVPPNLVGLCGICHGALHGNPGRVYGSRIDAAHVKRMIGRYIASEAGEDTRWYLVRKLGPGRSIAFLEGFTNA